MLKDFQSLNEIIDFFQEKIDNTTAGAKMSLGRIYNMALSWQEKETEKDKIKELFNSKSSLGFTKNSVQKVTIISTDIAIVETRERTETYFYAVVNSKKHYECAKTFDYALVLALSVKYGEEKCAPTMIYNMPNMYKLELMNKL